MFKNSVNNWHETSHVTILIYTIFRFLTTMYSTLSFTKAHLIICVYTPLPFFFFFFAFWSVSLSGYLYLAALCKLFSKKQSFLLMASVGSYFMFFNYLFLEELFPSVSLVGPFFLEWGQYWELNSGVLNH